jgi:hypothetical protein
VDDAPPEPVEEPEETNVNVGGLFGEDEDEDYY